VQVAVGIIWFYLGFLGDLLGCKTGKQTYY
jgi:hypothetical protein